MWVKTSPDGVAEEGFAGSLRSVDFALVASFQGSPLVPRYDALATGWDPPGPKASLERRLRLSTFVDKHFDQGSPFNLYSVSSGELKLSKELDTSLARERSTKWRVRTSRESRLSA